MCSAYPFWENRADVCLYVLKCNTSVLSITLSYLIPYFVAAFFVSSHFQFYRLLKFILSCDILNLSPYKQLDGYQCQLAQTSHITFPSHSANKMAANYVVMKSHRRIWHWLLTSEDMDSEKKFWIMLFIQSLNISFMFRCVLFVEGIEGKIEIIGPALCLSGGMYCYTMTFPNHRTIFDIISRLQKHYETRKFLR